MRQRLLILFAVLLLSTTAFAQPQITIGIVTDSVTQQEVIPLALLHAEINALTADEFQVQMPETKRLHGNGSLAGAKQALQKQLNDPEVDLIIALGLIASQAAAQIPELSKPVIATLVLDQDLQGFPYNDGSSGKHNFVYLTTFKSFEKELSTFYEMVNFKHLAILIDPAWLATLPQLNDVIAMLQKNNHYDITVVKASHNVNTLLSQLPQETDAVYVAPLLYLSESDTENLANQLIARQLPSFSGLGRHDVELGLLAAMGGMPEDKMRFARRIALDVQSILLGDEAGELSVIFEDNPKLTLNMQTARAINFTPTWRYLLEASLLYAEPEIPGEKLTLVQAMQTALRANLELQINELSVEVAAENVLLARANLLPQLVASTVNEQTDVNHTSALAGVAQNMTTGMLGAQQSIYSDAFWANFQVSQYIEESEDYHLSTVILNTLQNAGLAYLEVLRAQAIKEVQRANLSVTDVNLELAKMRDRVGFSSRADVLRWESQLATDQQDLLLANARVLQTQTELNRILNLPLQEVFKLSDEELGQFIGLLEDNTVRMFMNNPYGWKTFQSFAIEQTLAYAPELGEIQSLTKAKEREQLAAKRSFYLPDFNLEAGLNQVITRDGAGSDFERIGLNDTGWQVGVSATLPLLTGGARLATLSETGYQIEQLDLQTADTAEKLETRTRNILYQMGKSYPAIELSQEAALTAKENLSLVTDRYAQGTTDITDLIDAQNTALSADLSAAEARYAFLEDFIALLRSTNDLGLALEQDSLDQWFTRIEHFHEEQYLAGK